MTGRIPINGATSLAHAAVDKAQGRKPSRLCERCGKKMTFLATLPSKWLEPAKDIFRCHGCDHVAIDPK
jgi:hypothetical protein